MSGFLEKPINRTVLLEVLVDLGGGRLSGP